MCATVFYTKLIKGRLYPRAARTGPYAYANEVGRVRGKIVSQYLGIVKVAESAVVVESAAGIGVVENGGERNADRPDEPQQI